LYSTTLKKGQLYYLVFPLLQLVCYQSLFW
jgi:hypothetical protein